LGELLFETRIVGEEYVNPDALMTTPSDVTVTVVVAGFASPAVSKTLAAKTSVLEIGSAHKH
jgi:hypothetical protein